MVEQGVVGSNLRVGTHCFSLCYVIRGVRAHELVVLGRQVRQMALGEIPLNNGYF